MGRICVLLGVLMAMNTGIQAADIPVAEDLSVKFYGYVKVDVSYDQALSSHGDYIMYVKPHVLGRSTNTLSLTARQTRMGLNVAKGKTKGKFEVDFYGGGAENKNQLVLRLAYVDIPLKAFTLRAGQAADIISPLVPAMLNYTVGWGAGNIGYRRPLIQVSSQKGVMNWALGITRNIGSDLNGDSVVDGEDANIPTVQGRMGFKNEKIAFGISGHYGIMDSPGAAEAEYCTWSANADATVLFSSRVSLLAEAYLGVNTGTYFGAILNGDCVHDLKSRGGWVNLQVKTPGPVAFSFGGGLDDLVDEQKNYIAGLKDARTHNAFLFGQVTYEILNNVKTGIELSHWQTRYRNPSAGTDPNPTDVRLQWSIQSNF